MNIQKTTILLALAILFLGAGSCFAQWGCWYCYECGTEDWSGGGGCGSGSCGSGGGSGINTELSQGRVFYGANIPGGYPSPAVGGGGDGEIRFPNGNSATLMTGCGCVYFTADPNNPNSWTSSAMGMSMATTRDGEDTVTAATITSADGSTVTYDIENCGSDGKCLPSEMCDSSGAVTTYNHGDPETYYVQSITLPDGREYEYSHDWSGNLVGVTYPDGKLHMLIDGDLSTPNSVTYIDPDSYDQQGDIYYRESYADWTAVDYSIPGDEYGYDITEARKVTCVDGTENETKTVTRVYKSGYGTIYEMVIDDPIYVSNHPEEFPEGTPPKCYSMTKTSNDGVNGEGYGVITIRKYADPSEIWQWDSQSELWYMDNPDSVATSNSDRVTERWYYQNYGKNTFLRKDIVKWYEGETQKAAATTYTRITDSASKLYGEVTSVVDPLSRTTSYDYYDPAHKYDVSDPEVIPYPQDDVNGTVYGNGMLRQVTYPGDYTAAYNYKVVSGVMKPFIIRVKDTSGYVTKYEVNTDGSIAEVWNQIDSSTLVKTMSYTYYTTPNALKGRFETKTVYDVSSNGDDMVETYTYDIDENGECTVTATVENGANDRVGVMHYNMLGQMDWLKDEYNRQTDYTYDWQGRSVETEFPLVTGEGSRKTVEKNYGCCNLNWMMNENGGKAYYGYDKINRTTKIWTDITGQGLDDPLAEFTYNYFGKITTSVTQSDDSTDRATSYIYDNRGHLVKMVYPYETTEGDLLGSEEYLYDDVGRIVAKKDGNGDITACAYDDLSRLWKVDYDYSGDFELPISITSPDVTYEYKDGTDLVTEISETIDGTSVTTSYEYDRLGRIKTYTPPLPVGYGSITYTWNNLNEKTSMTVPMGFTGTHNARVYEYKYDMTGSQTGMVTIAANVTSNSTLATGSSGDTRFFYDGSMNRVKLITKAGDVYYFVYDPTASVPSVVYEAVNDGGTRITYLNARDFGSSLISRDTYEGTARTQSRTYHFDGLGSTVALTNEVGVVTDTYTYDEWGNVTPGQNNVTTDNPYQYVGQLGYYTHYQEPTLGMLQLGVRYYDSEIGRFTQRDAIKQGLSLYEYASSNPTNMVDPTGLKSKEPSPNRNFQRDCVANGGKYEFKVWSRRNPNMFHAKTFLKCLGKEFGIKGGICGLACLAIVGISGGTLPLAQCLVDCMNTIGGDDMASVDRCWDKAHYPGTEYYVTESCTYPAGSPAAAERGCLTVNCKVVNRGMQPTPPGKGWKPLHPDQHYK